MSKRAAGALLPTLSEQAQQLRGRRAQVYRTVLEQIRTGTLPPGARLPSARQLAREWQVARGVVDEAFAQLQAEGLLERRVGDGSYVRHDLPMARITLPAKLAPEANEAARRRLEQFSPYMAFARAFELPRQQFHPPILHPRAWPEALFPLDRWRRLMTAALQEEWRDHMGYGPTAGLPTLRSAIARHLALTRGLHCKGEQVIVVNGPLQGLETIARVLLKPGDAVWVEDPSHSSLPLLLNMLHCRVTGVPLDDEGFSTERALALAPDARLAYLHPLAQYPLGTPTSRARGDALLAWARESETWIVEGCFNDEIVHRLPAPPALMARDAAGRTILMGTFEGILYPSLRIGYLVVPERLADVFITARGPLGDHTPVAPQLALEAFIDGGHLTAHLRRLREVLGCRRDALRQAVRRWLPAEVILGRTDASWNACLHLPPRWPDADVLRALHARGIGCDLLSTRCWQATGFNGVVVAYAAWEPEAIDAAVRVIGEVLAAMPSA
jgi:GntR family transcriptional regulator / MocR family aminotransferase